MVIEIILIRLRQLVSMDRDGTWGSAIEIACLSHMLQVCMMYHMRYPDTLHTFPQL